MPNTVSAETLSPEYILILLWTTLPKRAIHQNKQFLTKGWSLRKGRHLRLFDNAYFLKGD